MLDSSILMAFFLTLIAGLATSLGGILAFFSKNLRGRFLSISLGFSAGVMIYVSFVEIFPKAQESLAEVRGESLASWLTVGGFFAGIAIMAIIDRLVPSFVNPHEVQHDESTDEAQVMQREKLHRMGIFAALAIAIHNFPEGFATFLATLEDPKLGVTIAIAIAIHNIPEGLAVSVPIYYATKSRKKAFWFASLSGLAEPLGAIIGYVLLRSLMNELFFGLSFSAVAGIMVYVSLDELLPTAEEYGKHHLAIGGLVAGMGVMALSLLLLA